MVFVWASRCLPAFSIVALLALLMLATDAIRLPWNIRYDDHFPFPGARPGNNQRPPSLAQFIFITYTLLIHVNMFAFTLRLSWSLFRVTDETKRVLSRRLSQASRNSLETQGYNVSISSQAAKWAQDSSQPNVTYSVIEAEEEPEVIHAIILPNYSEEIETLRTTLNVLASHPRAQSQYEIYLAMEQKELGVADKAAKLVSAYGKSFLSIRSTFHPAGLPGEIAGKSSNVAWSARHIAEVHQHDLNSGDCNVIITVMDADTHLWQDYFTEIRRLHYMHLAEADHTIYSCPIIFDRNSHETPILVRCADLLWAFAGLSTMYPGSNISIPTSVYSLPLSLAERIGGWDSDPTAIGEDMHMMLKCYFETAGNVVSRPIYVPASQCNVSSDEGHGWRRTLNTGVARYRQALRHMWGSLDSGFALRKSLGYLRFHSRCLFLRPRHLALLQLLFEAHFLPCHMIILIIFSTFYELVASPATLHPDLAWTFWVTGILRTSSILWMNVCLVFYERWHYLCVQTRRSDMSTAQLEDTGFSNRTWWHAQYLLERICFPIAGTVFGAVPTFHAVFAHLWTDRLVYRVSKKPAFASAASMMA